MDTFTKQLMDDISEHIHFFKKRVIEIDIFIEKKKDITFRWFLILRLDLLFEYIIFRSTIKKLKKLRHCLQELINLHERLKNDK
jgi:hypothetical protein